MLYRDWQEEKKDRLLKHSLEFCLTPEQREILHLEYLLGQKELELRKVKDERDKIADEPFERDFDNFVYNLQKQAELRKIQEKPQEHLEEDISFLSRVRDFALFVYAFYTIATSFLEKPGKKRQY